MIFPITIPTPFAIGDVQAYLVKGDALSLFDAGPKTKEAYDALKSGLKQYGYSFRDIEQVFLTHHHPDHAGWIDAFDRATIVGHPYNNLWLERTRTFFDAHDRFYYRLLKEWGVPKKYDHWVPKMKEVAVFLGDRSLDVQLKDGDDVPGHYGWKAIETLGHAQSHLAYYDEKHFQVIGGDLLLQKVSANPLVEPSINQNERPKTLLQQNASLRKLLTMPIEKIYPGHGDIVTDVEGLVKQRLGEQEQRAMRVFHMLESRHHTVFELNKMLFPKVYDQEVGLTLSETVGQVDYLLDKELIEAIEGEGQEIYYQQK